MEKRISGLIARFSLLSIVREVIAIVVAVVVVVVGAFRRLTRPLEFGGGICVRDRITRSNKYNDYTPIIYKLRPYCLLDPTDGVVIQDKDREIRCAR